MEIFLTPLRGQVLPLDCGNHYYSPTASKSTKVPLWGQCLQPAVGPMFTTRCGANVYSPAVGPMFTARCGANVYIPAVGHQLFVDNRPSLTILLSPSSSSCESDTYRSQARATRTPMTSASHVTGGWRRQFADSPSSNLIVHVTSPSTLIGLASHHSGGRSP